MIRPYSSPGNDEIEVSVCCSGALLSCGLSLCIGLVAACPAWRSSVIYMEINCIFFACLELIFNLLWLKSVLCKGKWQEQQIFERLQSSHTCSMIKQIANKSGLKVLSFLSEKESNDLAHCVLTWTFLRTLRAPETKLPSWVTTGELSWGKHSVLHILSHLL